MTDLISFDLALKISWVRRLVNIKGNWQNVFESETGVDKKIVWDLDCLSLEKISGKLTNQFWKEVFNAWAKYKSLYIEDIDVRSYPLWDSYVITNTNLLHMQTIMTTKTTLWGHPSPGGMPP